MRILKRLLIGLAILIVAALGALYIADPIIATRLVGFPFGGDSGPQELVAGANSVALPVAATSSIDAAALKAAIAYGAETKSHALLVWHAGALQLEHYYPGYGADTRTPTQSMHKSVLALMTGIAIRDGFIASVDEPAARYLPEWANDGRARITIRQMLQQASGIDFPTLGFNPVGGSFQMTIGGDVAPVALDQPLAGEPGAQFDYNNVNPQNLGLLIQRATGKRYAEYLSEALWKPIGADDAYLGLDSEEHRSPRYFCCLDATARSWLRVGLLHLNGGAWNGTQVVPAEWMQEVVTPSARNPNYGYYTWLGTRYEAERRYNHKSPTTAHQSEPYAANDMVYFDGFGGARVYIVRSLGLVIVRTGALAFEWDDAVLPNGLIRGIAPKADSSGGTEAAAKP